MGVMEQGRVIEGSGLNAPYYGAGAPVDGTDAVQSVDITGTPTGGTFRLAFGGKQTVDIAFDADAAAVEAALEGALGEGNVAVTGTNPNFAVTFGGDLGRSSVPLLTLADNSLTGGTDPSVDISEDTAGVDATGRRPAQGALYLDQTNGAVYVNAGSASQPSWSVATVT